MDTYTQQQFQGICGALSTHANLNFNLDTNLPYTLLDYVQTGICVALPQFPSEAIAMLQGLDLIVISNEIYIGLTSQGYEYYQSLV